MAKKQAKATPKAAKRPSSARPAAKAAKAAKKPAPKPPQKAKTPPKPPKAKSKPAPKAAPKSQPRPKPSKPQPRPQPKAQAPRPQAKAPEPRPAATAEAKPRPQPAASAPTSPQPSPAPSKSTPTPSAVSLINGVRYLTVEELVELHVAVDREIGGRNASPGVVESQFGLVRAVQVPQSTYLGREAYPAFGDKAAVLYWGILRDRPFKDGNRRVALVSLLVFCELNGATIDGKVLDERKLELLTKKAWSHKDEGVSPEAMFGEIRSVLGLAIRRGR